MKEEPGENYNKMKIYFSCSIIGDRQFQPAISEFVFFLKELGHEVLTERFAAPDIQVKDGHIPAAQIYQRDMAWLKECDLVIAEVSSPSIGVGYEIGCSVSMGKRTLCIYREGQKVSKMILGNDHPCVQTSSYKEPEDARRIIKNWLDKNCTDR